MQEHAAILVGSQQGVLVLAQEVEATNRSVMFTDDLLQGLVGKSENPDESCLHCHSEQVVPGVAGQGGHRPFVPQRGVRQDGHALQVLAEGEPVGRAQVCADEDALLSDPHAHREPHIQAVFAHPGLKVPVVLPAEHQRPHPLQFGLAQLQKRGGWTTFCWVGATLADGVLLGLECVSRGLGWRT